MFYKTGIDITNDKQMFNFIKEHYEYPTMNYWNGRYSIANNVKLYNLGLSGNWCTALALLEEGEYEQLNWLIQEWEEDAAHKGFTVYFNGRSGGYLVLTERGYNGSILPESITDCDTYEDYKSYCREYYGSVKANRDDLVFYTKLIQDFDKLCDQLRVYCDELSKLNVTTLLMQQAVERFNEDYSDDLELLGFSELECSDEGTVNVGDIQALQSLFEAFCRLAERRNYVIKHIDNYNVQLCEK